jgi:hypothetical protein
MRRSGPPPRGSTWGGILLERPVYPARAAMCAWSSAPGEKRAHSHRSLPSPVAPGHRTAGKGPGRLRQATPMTRAGDRRRGRLCGLDSSLSRRCDAERLCPQPCPELGDSDPTESRLAETKTRPKWTQTTCKSAPSKPAGPGSPRVGFDSFAAPFANISQESARLLALMSVHASHFRQFLSFERDRGSQCSDRRPGTRAGMPAPLPLT